MENNRGADDATTPGNIEVHVSDRSTIFESEVAFLRAIATVAARLLRSRRAGGGKPKHRRAHVARPEATEADCAEGA